MEKLTHTTAILARNISILYATAKLELERKSNQITQLRREVQSAQQRAKHFASQKSGELASSDSGEGAARKRNKRDHKRERSEIGGTNNTEGGKNYGAVPGGKVANQKNHSSSSYEAENKKSNSS